MSIAYFIIFGTIALLGVSAAFVFGWAIQSGQFSDFEKGATSIFDADEPLGEMTDFFPGQQPGSPGATDPSQPSPDTAGNNDVDNR